MSGLFNDMNKLIILAGPSCVGKTPLVKAFNQLFPQQAASIQNIIPYTTRLPRPDETNGVDYYFTNKNNLESIRAHHDITTISVRGDLQGISLQDIPGMLNKSSLLYEGNTYLAQVLIGYAKKLDIPHISIFLSPFYFTEIKTYIEQLGEKGAQDLISLKMSRKIIKRAKRKKYPGNENITQRAREAYEELALAGQFDHVIVNAFGEEDAMWDNPEKLKGSTLGVVQTFAELVFDGRSDHSEKWPADFFKPIQNGSNQ